MCEYVKDCKEDCNECPFFLDERLSLEKSCEEYNKGVEND